MTDNDTPALKKPFKRLPRNGALIRCLAIEPAIRAELALGHTVKMIYDKHQAALGCSYKSLAWFIRRYTADARPQLTLPLERSSQSRDSSTRDHSGHADPATIRRLIKG